MKFWNWKRRRSVWKDVAIGALGGFAGSVAMNGFQAAVSAVQKRRENGPSSRDAQRGEQEEPATAKVADAVAENAGYGSIPKSKKGLAGAAVHYGFGTLNGIAYQLLARKVGATKAGYGTLYGAGLWALADEVAVPALGLSKSPKQTPASSHLYALASHLVFGLTADTSIRLARKLV